MKWTALFVTMLAFLLAAGDGRQAPAGDPRVASGQAMAVCPTLETAPVPSERDAADDPCVWIHPSDPARSTIIGTNKKGPLCVFDLSGATIQQIGPPTGNVDLRYNFPLAGERVALVCAFNKEAKTLIAYRVDPKTRQLVNITHPAAKVRYQGTALYHSPVSGKYYYFANGGGNLTQYELFDDAGKVNARQVRSIRYGKNTTEAVVADDALQYVYVSEETTALWRFGAEPDAGEEKLAIDRPISEGGHFKPDLEGLAIYYKSDGAGYLIASSQGNDTYNIYQREPPHAYLGTFRIEAGNGIDGTSNTDGIDVVSFPLGKAFPQGLFVVQDGANTDPRANQNFKIVPWQSIAAKFGLSVDTTWDPRKVGAQ